VSELSAAAVRSFVLEGLTEPLERLGMRPEQVPDDFDLLTSGVIDSFGVLELIGDVENRFGLEIDFERLDPEGLTVIGTFSRYVAKESRQANGRGAAGSPG
jgi:acyl carrier protein